MRNIVRTLQWAASRSKIEEIPSLRTFMKPSLKQPIKLEEGKYTFHIQTYGCQMNTNDSQIVRSVLSESYAEIEDPNQAHILLINTCSIREAAQEKIFNRLKEAKSNVIIGILGCMAERLKDKLFAVGVQVICGPDAYRDLPRLLQGALDSNNNQINVMLSAEETYADITPIRKNLNNVSAFLSIMRGCNNMCSFCIVPFVRGRERSRNLETIMDQIACLEKQGVKEITFLGQNVNSYHDTTTHFQSSHNNSPGFSEMYKLRQQPGARFADLLKSAATRFPNLRFRFTSPHPKDFPNEVLEAIATHHNICKHVHLPAQSGSNEILSKMRRNHTIQSYFELVDKLRAIPGLAISTDLIAGFCGQTEQQFKETLQLIRKVKYEMAFLFAYSMREKTHAHRNYEDDVPYEVKQRRLNEMINLFTQVLVPLNSAEVGKLHLILIEGRSKRDPKKLLGKTDNFKTSFAEKAIVPVYENKKIIDHREFKFGDYLAVKVESVKPRALYCKPIGIAATLSDFHSNQSFYQDLANSVELSQATQNS